MMMKRNPFSFWVYYHCLNLFLFVILMLVRGGGSGEQLGFALWGGVAITLISFLLNLILTLFYIALAGSKKVWKVYEYPHYILWLFIVLVTIFVPFLAFGFLPSSAFEKKTLSEKIDVLAPHILLFVSTCFSFIVSVLIKQRQEKSVEQGI